MLLFDKVGATISEGISLVRDREIRLGVTGLSRGGKTALITSLVNNISAFGLKGYEDRMPRFPEYAARGISYGGIAKSRDFSVTSFPYGSIMKTLEQDPPEWPESTDGISEIRLEIRYRNSRWYLMGDEDRIFLDIWDYPGEWLMDLMLLDMEYEDFSEKCRERLRVLDGVVSGKEFADRAAKLNWQGAVIDDDLHEAVTAYTFWLRKCKDQGFALLIPGRFLLPGELKGAPALEFIPCPDPEAGKNAGSSSLYAVLRERYNYYRDRIVRGFYRECFSRLDRQIVLVDCLKALRGGRETFYDINDAFDTLLSHFSYGNSSFLSRIFSPRIDRVLFAASKADHITNDQHQNLLSLLRSMVLGAMQSVRSSGSQAEFVTLSAIRATECRHYKKGDLDTDILVTGYPDEKPYYPGSIPSKWSREDMEFFQKNFDFRALRPPRLGADRIIPSMNLDVVLHYILGDKL